MGIAKIIFDYIKPLRPYGYLIGGDEDNKAGTIWEKRIRSLKRG